MIPQPHRTSHAADSAAPEILSLATAVPGYVLKQGDVAEVGQSLFGNRPAAFERLRPVYANAGIAKRHSCMPLDWYLRPSDWKTRNGLYLEHAPRLLAQAATDCLQRAGIAAGAVDHLVTVSSTGVATPSLDAHLMQRLALRPDVQRLPVFGLGCAGGVLGLSRAAAVARSKPGCLVLLLVVELCALTFRANDESKANIVATALFGDGAAALLLSCPNQPEPRGAAPRIAAAGEHTWPDSLGVMGWSVENDGLGVIFSRDIPTIVRRQMGEAADEFLAREGLSREDLAGYICHPGGAKVIAALEDTFSLPPSALSDSREVLRDYGNMSAASVLFVLERALRKRLDGRYLLTALGPGFTAAFALLEARPSPQALRSAAE